MTDIIIDAGTLTANREERIVSGLLLPYGEECRSNLGRFSYSPGKVEIPGDLTGMGLNVEHERERVVGEPVAVVETPAGVVATFKLAKTPEGDAALEDIAAGRRRHLSAEVSDVRIKNGKGIGGRLFGAALVAEPAFPSATLLAAADDIDPENTVVEEHHAEDTFVDDDGVTWTRVVDTEVETETDADGVTTTTTTTVVEETEEPADEPDDTEEEPDVATVPNTLTAAKATGKKTPALRDIVAAIAAVKAGEHQGEAATLLAALSDIKISGANTLPVGGGAIRENWVGQLWQGKEYQRKYINLSKLGTEITAGGKKGYKVARGTAASPSARLGGDWAGNKTEVPSGGGFTTSVSSSLDRFAWAADIAREFYDLPGGEEVIAAFLRLITEDYAVWSDEKALAFTVTQAGAPIAPGAYPAVAGHDYPPAMGQLIQGIIAVDDAKDTPSYAIVNPVAYEQLVYTPKDLIPEFVSFAVNTEGTGTADGKVGVVKAPASFFTGVDNDEPAVIVGAKNAIEFDELGETPLSVDALEIAKGGIDRGVHGYLQKFAVRPESIVLVGTAPTP